MKFDSPAICNAYLSAYSNRCLTMRTAKTKLTHKKIRDRSKNFREFSAILFAV